MAQRACCGARLRRGVGALYAARENKRDDKRDNKPRAPSSPGRDPGASSGERGGAERITGPRFRDGLSSQMPAPRLAMLTRRCQRRDSPARSRRRLVRCRRAALPYALPAREQVSRPPSAPASLVRQTGGRPVLPAIPAACIGAAVEARRSMPRRGRTSARVPPAPCSNRPALITVA